MHCSIYGTIVDICRHCDKEVGVAQNAVLALSVFAHAHVTWHIGPWMDGTAVVTGSNTGIGKQTALELSKSGCRVILGCRNKEAGEAACQEISRSEPGNLELNFTIYPPVMFLYK